MSEKHHIVCPSCNGTNNIPTHATKANCGRCKHDLLDTTPVTLTPENFNQHVEKNDIPVVVDFWAPWCGPCKQMAPVFTKVAGDFKGKARFSKLNTEDFQQLAGSYGIRSIPTMILFKNGKELDRVSGALDATGMQNWVKRFT